MSYLANATRSARDNCKSSVSLLFQAGMIEINRERWSRLDRSTKRRSYVPALTILTVLCVCVCGGVMEGQKVRVNRRLRREKAVWGSCKGKRNTERW